MPTVEALEITKRELNFNDNNTRQEDELIKKSRLMGFSFNETFGFGTDPKVTNERTTPTVLGFLISLAIFVACLLFIGLSFLYPYYEHTYTGAILKKHDDHLYLYWQNNQIYLCGFVSGTVLAVIAGITCCTCSWIITYYDSLEPGYVPPTPLSPSKLRKRTGHTFHSSYTIAIVNGFLIFAYCLWCYKDRFLF